MVKLDGKKIETAIREAEKRTSGEIRVHVRRRSKGDALRAAQRIFERLGMHRTRERNGVLIFAALDDRLFAVIGDRAIHQRVGGEFWNQTCDAMARLFSAGRVEDALVEGVKRTGAVLESHFPRSGGDQNELSDNVTED